MRLMARELTSLLKPAPASFNLFSIIFSSLPQTLFTNTYPLLQPIHVSVLFLTQNVPFAGRPLAQVHTLTCCSCCDCCIIAVRSGFPGLLLLSFSPSNILEKNLACLPCCTFLPTVSNIWLIPRLFWA